MSYAPLTSGYLTGWGSRRSKRRRNVIRHGSLRHMPDMHLSDIEGLKREIPDYDPTLEFEYTKRELILLAEKILLTDKPCQEEPMWLNTRMYLERIRREIQTATGTPDSAFASGMYWRTHPEGRKVNSDEQRAKNAASYYR